MLARLIQSDSLVFLYDELEKACLLEIKKAVIVDHNYVVDNDCFYAYNRACYSDLNKSLIPPMLPIRLVAS